MRRRHRSARTRCQYRLPTRFHIGVGDAWRAVQEVGRLIMYFATSTERLRGKAPLLKIGCQRSTDAATPSPAVAAEKSTPS